MLWTRQYFPMSQEEIILSPLWAMVYVCGSSGGRDWLCAGDGGRNKTTEQSQRCFLLPEI